MKRTYTVLLLGSIVQASFGQYVFSSTTQPYQELAAPLPVNDGVPWTNSSAFQVTFGFPFSILGQSFTALNVMAGGGLSFPGLGEKRLRVFNHPDSGYLLEDRDQANSASPITYGISGGDGQHILKVQWANAGFREWCASSDPDDFVNFQIWLFEDDNHIEVHFGEHVADAGAYGQPDCNSGTDGTQFIFIFDECSNALSLTGPATLPSYNFRNHCIYQPGVHVSGTPPSGTIYQLLPGTVSIQAVDAGSALDLHCYPNPTNGILHIEGIPQGSRCSFQISDLGGRACYTVPARFWTGNDLIDLRGLDNGLYSMKMEMEGREPIIRKVVIAR